MSQRVLAPVVVAAALLISLSGCAATAPVAQPPVSASGPEQGASATPEGAQAAPESAWPGGWPETLPHLNSGEVLYSHAEADRIYKIGMRATPEAHAQLLADFATAGFSDEAASGRDDQHDDAHSFRKDGWRVIVRGVQTDAAFEVHYIARRER